MLNKNLVFTPVYTLYLLKSNSPADKLCGQYRKNGHILSEQSELKSKQPVLMNELFKHYTHENSSSFPFQSITEN